MIFRTGDLEDLPHKVLGLMTRNPEEHGGPWYVTVVHGMRHMESKYQGYLIGQEGHEIILDRCDDKGELIGVKVILHEDWIQEVVVP